MSQWFHGSFYFSSSDTPVSKINLNKYVMNMYTSEKQSRETGTEIDVLKLTAQIFRNLGTLTFAKKPLMVKPGTLVIWVSEKGILRQLKLWNQ